MTRVIIFDKIYLKAGTTRKWRIIRSHYYYNYDLSMYVIEDDSHKEASNQDETHAYIFDYVCSALYKYGFDNQNLHYEVDDELDVDEDGDGPIDDITDMIDLSNLFIIYAHGKEDGSEIILNAKDSLNYYKGTKISYHRSNITNLPADSLDSLGCAIFFVCHSAQGIYANESSANFVNAVMGRGAQSAIGFDGQVACDDIDSFSLAFFAQYSDMVGNISARALESYEAAVFYGDVVYTNGFSPYFTNEYISLTKPN